MKPLDPATKHDVQALVKEACKPVAGNDLAGLQRRLIRLQELATIVNHRLNEP